MCFTAEQLPAWVPAGLSPWPGFQITLSLYRWKLVLQPSSFPFLTDWICSAVLMNGRNLFLQLHIGTNKPHCHSWAHKNVVRCYMNITLAQVLDMQNLTNIADWRPSAQPADNPSDRELFWWLKLTLLLNWEPFWWTSQIHMYCISTVVIELEVSDTFPSLVYKYKSLIFSDCVEIPALMSSEEGFFKHYSKWCNQWLMAGMGFTRALCSPEQQPPRLPLLCFFNS